MVLEAKLKFSQGALTPPGGQALAVVAGSIDDVVVANTDNTEVASWKIELLYGPPGSIFERLPGDPNLVASSADGDTPSYSFQPAVGFDGECYRFRLRVWSGTNFSGVLSEDIRCVAVPRGAASAVFPPNQIDPPPDPSRQGETNFGGQRFGWSGDTQGDSGGVRLVNPLLAWMVDEMGTGALTPPGGGGDAGKVAFANAAGDDLDYADGITVLDTGGAQDGFSLARLQFGTGTLPTTGELRVAQGDDFAIVTSVSAADKVLFSYAVSGGRIDIGDYPGVNSAYLHLDGGSFQIEYQNATKHTQLTPDGFTFGPATRSGASFGFSVAGPRTDANNGVALWLIAQDAATANSAWGGDVHVVTGKKGAGAALGQRDGRYIVEVGGVGGVECFVLGQDTADSMTGIALGDVLTWDTGVGEAVWTTHPWTGISPPYGNAYGLVYVTGPAGTNLSYASNIEMVPGTSESALGFRGAGASPFSSTEGDIRGHVYFKITGWDSSGGTATVDMIRNNVGELYVGDNAHAKGIYYDVADGYAHMMRVDSTFVFRAGYDDEFYTAFGANPALSGTQRWSRGGYIVKGRNAADDADLSLITWTASGDGLYFGGEGTASPEYIEWSLKSGANFIWTMAGSNAVKMGGSATDPWLQMGADAATPNNGAFRMRNGFKLVANDAAGTPNEATLIEWTTGDDLFFGDSTHVDNIYNRIASGGVLGVFYGGTSKLRLGDDFISFGLTGGAGGAATFGKFRVAKVWNLYARNNAEDDDIPLIDYASDVITWGSSTKLLQASFRVVNSQSFYIGSNVRFGMTTGGLGFFNNISAQKTDIGSLTDNTAGAATDNVVQALTDPADAPATADALRDDLVTNLIPELRNNFKELLEHVNALRDMASATAGGFGLMA